MRTSAARRVWLLRRVRARCLAVACASALSLGGCAAPPEADTVLVDSSRYTEAFDAAERAAHDLGFSAAFRDPRGGVIETSPSLAPTLLEPWRNDGSTLGRRVEQTLSFERRRARFEFAPHIAQAASEQPNAGAAMGADMDDSGPDLLGLTGGPRDLTEYTGPLELRVVVVVELASSPGVRPDTWSLRKTTQTRIVPPGRETPLPMTFWTPVTRDRALERRLLGEVASALAGS